MSKIRVNEIEDLAGNPFAGGGGSPGPAGDVGATGPQGPAGPSNVIDSTNTQSNITEYYPVFVEGSGNQTPRVTTGGGQPEASKFTFRTLDSRIGCRYVACEQNELGLYSISDVRIQAGSTLSLGSVGSSAGGVISFVYGASQQYEVRFGAGGPFRPESVNDNQCDLGNSNGRWRQIYAVNNTINTSDEREKTEITDSVLGTDFIKSLRPVSYKWITNGSDYVGTDEEGNKIFNPTPGQRTHYGFIAQELKQSIDASGVEDCAAWTLGDKDDPDSRQGIRYAELIAPLTKALQEALERIDTLETEVATLKGT